MTRWVASAIPLVVLLGVLVGILLPPVPALVVGIIAAAAVAALVWQRQRRLVGRVAAHIVAWENAPRDRLELEGSSPWRRLATLISELGQRMDQLERERHGWQAEVVDAISSPALVFSSDGSSLLAANAAAIEKLSVPTDGVGRRLVSVLGSRELADALLQVVDTGVGISVDAEIRECSWHVVVTPVDDALVMIAEDRSVVERVGRLRRDFVISASHELKTPVAGMTALADALAVLLAEHPDERVLSATRRLRGEAERLGQLVHDLLDLRRLEDDAEGPRHGPVDLVDLVSTVVASVMPAAEQAGIHISVEVPDAVTLSGSRTDLVLVVENLVRNAVHYNRPGGEVTVSLVERAGEVVFTVADTGIGIPRAELQRVFQRFHRVDAARSRETGGTGLGLSIVRHAVEHHGGTVTVESLLGRGSTFTVVLPHPPVG